MDNLYEDKLKFNILVIFSVYYFRFLKLNKKKKINRF